MRAGGHTCRERRPRGDFRSKLKVFSSNKLLCGAAKYVCIFLSAPVGTPGESRVKVEFSLPDENERVE